MSEFSVAQNFGANTRFVIFANFDHKMAPTGCGISIGALSNNRTIKRFSYLIDMLKNKVARAFTVYRYKHSPLLSYFYKVKLINYINIGGVVDL